MALVSADRAVWAVLGPVKVAALENRVVIRLAGGVGVGWEGLDSAAWKEVAAVVGSQAEVTLVGAGAGATLATVVGLAELATLAARVVTMGLVVMEAQGSSHTQEGSYFFDRSFYTHGIRGHRCSTIRKLRNRQVLPRQDHQCKAAG